VLAFLFALPNSWVTITGDGLGDEFEPTGQSRSGRKIALALGMVYGAFESGADVTPEIGTQNGTNDCLFSIP
jgi:hypothetical protein